MHKIKKYANRKMYDTHDKRYVTMAQLSELIKQGEEVMVIDNRTGEDITTAIISQLIGRDHKEKDTTVSSQLLMQLLRKGGGHPDRLCQKIHVALAGCAQHGGR